MKFGSMMNLFLVFWKCDQNYEWMETWPRVYTYECSWCWSGSQKIAIYLECLLERRKYVYLS